MKRRISAIAVEDVESCIKTVRGQKVILDSDLARIYGVETKAFNRAFKRNANRFPADFAFQLTREEMENLRYQFGTSSSRVRRAPLFTLWFYGKWRGDVGEYPKYGPSRAEVCSWCVHS